MVLMMMTEGGANLGAEFASKHLKRSRVLDWDAPLGMSYFRALKARVEPTTCRRDLARVVPT